MATYFTGTLLASPIVRGSSGDTYGTHHSILGVGGYMEVNSLAERNLLPIDTVNGIGYDGISSGQRRLGMLVYVHSEDTIYQLKIAQSTWNSLTSAGKLTELANNSNWAVFVSGENVAETGERIYRQFQQPTHGFIKGDVIGYSGTTSTSEFIKVDSYNAAIVEPLGIVTKVIDSNTFNLTFSGYINTSGITDVNTDPIEEGVVYYLSSTEGKLTPTKPTSFAELSKPMLVGLSGNTGVVLQYRGLYETITSGGTVSYSEFTGYTATTQLFLDETVTGATNIGFFTGYTGLQTLPINHLSDNAYDGNYVSLYNHYYRDSDGYIRIGAASDGIKRRGYLRATLPAKSWVWNEYTGGGQPIGWIFINHDVSSDSVYGYQYTGVTDSEYEIPAYSASSWNTGSFYNNGSQIVVDTVIGSLTTGNTYILGGPVYNDKVDQNLRLRTIKSLSPTTLSVKYDDYFIKLSATTASDIENVGTGVPVFSGNSGTTALFKTIIGGGDTIITDAGNSIIISSTGAVAGTFGENITKRITKIGHGFSTKQVIGWSGGTYNKAIADGTYGGEIIGIVSNVVDANNFDLTQAGFITGLTGLITNTTYYVSTITTGSITTGKTSTVGQLVRPILIANSSTTGWVLPYEGYIVTSGGTGGGDIYYTGKTPSTISVGNLPAGTTLTGRTLSSLLEQMLVATIYPILTAPSNSFSDNVSNTYEVGTVIDIDFTAGFNRGSICLGTTFQDYRSGNVNCYYYNGSGLPSSVASTSLSNIQTVSGFTVVNGATSWNSCVGYDCGPQPLDSDGCNYSSPLPSGITSAQSTSVTGIYPYYWGTFASGGAPAGSNRPSSTNDLVTGGTKVLTTSNGTLNIVFSSTADDYLWFAIPSTSTSKTCWYVDVLNNGAIGGSVSPGGNLFPDFDTVAVCSAQGCWNNVNYKVYVSNYQSAISSNMELRNS